MNNFDTMEKELGEKRGVISALDSAKEVVAIATVAIDLMIETRNKNLATTIVDMKIKEAVSKLFPEEPDAEKPAGVLSKDFMCRTKKVMDSLRVLMDTHPELNRIDVHTTREHGFVNVIVKNGSEDELETVYHFCEESNWRNRNERF